MIKRKLMLALGSPKTAHRRASPAPSGSQRVGFQATPSSFVRCKCMVFAEYTLLTGIVVLTAGLALYALGVPLVQVGARVGAAGWG